MICKICKNENAQEAKFCANCGTALEKKIQKPQKPMRWHYAWSVVQFVMAGSALSSMLLAMATEAPFVLLLMLLYGVFSLLTGIFLLKRMKAGLVMSFVKNVVDASLFAYLSCLCIYLIVLGFIGAGGYDGLGIVIGGLLFFPAFAVTVINVVTGIYYCKRVHIFGKRER